MVPSIDTYLKKEVTKMLEIILHECYIINEVLRDFDKSIVDTFIKAYGGDNPKNEVKVTFALTDIKVPVYAGYVIELGEGSETRDSLGGIEGTFTYNEDSYENEYATIIREGERLFVKVSKPIGEFLGSESISFAESDNVQVEGDKIYFDYLGNEILEGKSMSIQYVSKQDSTSGYEPHGTHRGFTGQETVHISAISTNVDTVRCLDAILKTILIMLRQQDQEQNYYALQRLRFSGTNVVISDGDTRVFGRTASLSYVVSYSVEQQVSQLLSKVELREVMKHGKSKKE